MVDRRLRRLERQAAAGWLCHLRVREAVPALKAALDKEKRDKVATVFAGVVAALDPDGP